VSFPIVFIWTLKQSDVRGLKATDSSRGLWDVTSFSVVVGHQRFGCPCCLHHHFTL